MKCPDCNFIKTKVEECRLMGNTGGNKREKVDCNNIFRRRRVCLNCSRQFSTYEVTFDDWCNLFKELEQNLKNCAIDAVNKLSIKHSESKIITNIIHGLRSRK